MATFTTDELLDSVKSRIYAPSSQATITDAEILRIASEELLGDIVPDVKNIREKFYIYSESLTITNGRARIPYRSFGSSVANIIGVLPGGQEDRIPEVRSGEMLALNYQDASAPWAGYVVFYLDGSDVVFNPTNLDGRYSSVTIKYPMSPNSLCLTTDARQITAVTSTTITLSSALSTLTDGVLFDVIDNKSPFAIKTYDQSGTVASSVITMTAVPSNVAVGQWVSLAGTSPIPQIPNLAHPVLRYEVVARCLEAIGSYAGVQPARDAAAKIAAKIGPTLSPRVDGQPHYFRPGSRPFSRGMSYRTLLWRR